MIFNRKLLQFMGFTSVSREEMIKIDPSETSELLEEEVQQNVAILSTMNPESQEYRNAAESTKVLCEAIEKHDKARTERMKVALQIEEARKRRAVDWGKMTPTIVGIVTYGLITCVLFGLERQTPLSMRWLRALDILVAPKI